MNKTGIEYLDYTWNPIAMRCTPISEGCANCWHLKTAHRMSMNCPSFPLKIREAYAGERGPVIIKERLNDPQKRKKLAQVGVQFMGDLFHDDVPFPWVDDVFSVFNLCPHHTFIVLTKRPGRMLEWYNQVDILGWGAGDYNTNVWIGVTAENQERADERIPILLQIPAAVRFVSVEPMLGPVDISEYLRCQYCGYSISDTKLHGDHRLCKEYIVEPNVLDWAICGGETGPGARPMHPDWARSLSDQCQAAGVPFFFKQWGQYVTPSQALEDTYREMDAFHGQGFDESENAFYGVGKKKAGRLLNGREWNEYPKEEP